MRPIIWPDALCPRTFSLKLVADVRVAPAVYGGSEIVNDFEDDVWEVSMEVDSRSGDNGATLEALVNYLQGGVNTVEFGHYARPVPRGTVTHTKLASSAVKGADSVELVTSAGQIVKAGDFFGVGGLLLQASQDVTATGSTLVVPVVNRLRKPLNVSTEVNFCNPKLFWRLSSASGVKNLMGYTGPVSLTFTEDV